MRYRFSLAIQPKREVLEGRSSYNNAREFNAGEGRETKKNAKRLILAPLDQVRRMALYADSVA